jgi:heme/copper-type cytochrome/quinol oxidase subunit 2
MKDKTVIIIFGVLFSLMIVFAIGFVIEKSNAKEIEKPCYDRYGNKIKELTCTGTPNNISFLLFVMTTLVFVIFLIYRTLNLRWEFE